MTLQHYQKFVLHARTWHGINSQWIYLRTTWQLRQVHVRVRKTAVQSWLWDSLKRSELGMLQGFTRPSMSGTPLCWSAWECDQQGRTPALAVSVINRRAEEAGKTFDKPAICKVSRLLWAACKWQPHPLRSVKASSQIQRTQDGA